MSSWSSASKNSGSSLISAKGRKYRSARHTGITLSCIMRIYFEFIALIVRNRIYNLLKDALLRFDSWPNYMSVLAALQELEKIEMIRRSNGQYRMDYTVSKIQKVILNAFGMDENDIRSTPAEISGLLTADQSFLCSIKRRKIKVTRMKAVSTIEAEIPRTEEELPKIRKKYDSPAESASRHMKKSRSMKIGRL